MPTRDHTERLLQHFDYPLETDTDTIRLQGQQSLEGTQINIPGDISSAAFFIVGASIAAGSCITIERVGINPRRMGLIRILQKMGAQIEIFNRIETGYEPMADIRVQASKLSGIDIDSTLVPSAIDEFPILFIAAACAEGKTTMHGLAELRHKESDRIASMVNGLQQLGINIYNIDNAVVINGGIIRGGECDSAGDHRVAMAFAMAALCAQAPITIKNTVNVATSFPGFVDMAKRLGLTIKEVC